MRNLSLNGTYECMMKHDARPTKTMYNPAIGPVGDIKHVFRRLGGLSRLDVVFSLVSIGCVAAWRCLLNGKRKAVRASIRPAVYLLTYIPADSKQETA